MNESLTRYIQRWWWQIRFWWIYLPCIKEAYLSGYYMGWTDHRVMPDYQNPDSAFDEWVSRLGDKY